MTGMTKDDLKKTIDGNYTKIRSLYDLRQVFAADALEKATHKLEIALKNLEKQTTA